MGDRWAVEMVDALRSGGGGRGWMFAQIKSVAPLTILAYDQVISRGLYINPDLLVWTGGGGYVLKAGDTVVVLQVGAEFYILERVVKV